MTLAVYNLPNDNIFVNNEMRTVPATGTNVIGVSDAEVSIERC